MEYSDDKINPDEQIIADAVETKSSVKVDADGIIAPESSENHKKSGSLNNSDVGVSELVAIAVKTIAVTIAFILLLTGVLAVCLPLSSMRVFNKLGFIERSVDFGERYISRELKAYNADNFDQMGNYRSLAQTSELNNDDFVEALYVCINNSYELMNKYLESGDSSGKLEYYARRIEKYTRMYSSLNGVSLRNRQKSEYNVTAMPLLEMRPSVYSYGHTVRNMNYRARAVLGETDRMLYNSNEDGNIVATLTERTNTLSGIVIQGETRDNLIGNLDMYIDYIDALGEYIDVEFIRAGVENNPVAKKRYFNKQTSQMTEGYVYTETYVQNVYTNFLSGNEFSLLLTKQDGFTTLYNRLQRFKEFSQAAVDFTPDDRNNNKLDEMLHQLYWLQTLSATSFQLWYLDYLLYFNRDMFGAASEAVRDNYGTLVALNSVVYEGKTMQISEVYAQKLNDYKKIYTL